jgi:Hemopexin
MAIQACVTWNNGKAYFFRRNKFYAYDMASDRADAGYPQLISSAWPGLWADGIDDGVLWDNDTAYFFKGKEYVRYDVGANQVVAGYPKPIAGNWNGLWADGIDAVVLWNNGKAYFFKGTEYIRYDVASDQADGPPQPIAGNWPGMFDVVDAAALWNNGKAYFFRRNQYLRYDVASDTTDAGTPTNITNNWPDLEAVTLFYDRTEWNADTTIPRLGNAVARPDRNEVFIHHTVISDQDSTPNEFETLTKCFNGMRVLQRTRPDLGLDVPYNFVAFVMSNGDLVLCEGRGFDRDGAHTKGHNTNGIAVSFQGNFEATNGPADFDSLLEGLGWWLRKLRRNDGFTALGDSHPTNGREVFGHRDVASTACPGKNLYAMLDRVVFL